MNGLISARVERRRTRPVDPMRHELTHYDDVSGATCRGSARTGHDNSITACTSPDAAPAGQDLFATDHLEHNLKSRSVRGGIVTVAAQAMKFILRVVSTAILARLVTPEEFGLVAMTGIISGFVGLLASTGLGQATVQRDRITHAQISALFWVNCALGAVVAAIVVALAPGIAWFYGDARLAPISWVLAIPFLLGGASVQHGALLRRQMHFKALAGIELGSMVTGIAVAIWMAVAGLGYWALVAKVVAEAGATLLGVWIVCGWRPGLPRRGSGVRSLLGFGADVLTFNVANYFTRNADNLLIGWRWGAAPLGIYEKAYSLLLLPIQQINSPISAVVIPALSRAQMNSRLFREIFLSTLELVTSVSVPMVFLSAALSEPLVRVWLGPTWLPVADLFEYLALAGLLSALGNVNGWLLISTGRTKRYRSQALAIAPCMLLAFWLGLPHGAPGVAVAYSGLSLVLFPFMWIWTVRGTSIRPRDLAGTILPAVLAAGIATCVLLLVRDNSAPPIANLTVSGGVFAISYVGLYVGVMGKGRGLLRMLRHDARLDGRSSSDAEA
jgi:O-antigen/teichoic acid export membrane protein